MSPKPNLITESIESKPASVDREAGLIRGVKILGLEAPKTGRRYTMELRLRGNDGRALAHSRRPPIG